MCLKLIGNGSGTSIDYINYVCVGGWVSVCPTGHTLVCVLV